MINDISSFQSAIAGLGTSLGRAGLNALYPDEFEYYALTLELVNSQGKTKEMLIFPVTPYQISESTQNLVNVKKSSSAMISLINSTFPIKSVKIDGTFGRKIRILVGGVPLSNTFSVAANVNANDELSANIKTGYGVTKVLERILKESMTVDEFNLPHFLFLYNPALGNDYLVECADYTFHQAMESNMMWNYTVLFKPLAYAKDVDIRSLSQRNKSLMNTLLFSSLNKTINDVASQLSGINQSLLASVSTYQK